MSEKTTVMLFTFNLMGRCVLPIKCTNFNDRRNFLQVKYLFVKYLESVKFAFYVYLLHLF